MKYIIGVDEVGRGPLAGPVTVAAVAATVNLKSPQREASFLRGRQISPKRSKLPTGQANLKITLKDSKRLSAGRREEWFAWIKKMQKDRQLFCAIASVYPRTIDRLNISRATNLAAERAVLEVLKKKAVKTRDISIYLDGGLHPFSPEKLQTVFHELPTTNCKLQTIIRGDEKIPVISLASIAAKVTRDRYMRKLHKKHPQYSFDAHKGYGTKRHISAVKKYGPCSHHRLTFVEKYTIVNK